MDNQEYLNQIAAATRPAKAKKMGGILPSKYLKIALIALGVVLVVVIIGSIISGSRGSVQDSSIKLKLKLDRTMAVISEYQSSVKSSELRASSASFYGVLSTTDSELTTYLTDKYNYKDGSNKKLAEAADAEKDALASDLQKAKITGTLDRTYAHKMALEITAIMKAEASIAKMSSDATLDALLNNSYSSLNNLYTQFNDFSEAK